MRGFKDDKGAKAEAGNDVGTGVVIVDKGIILTNLHVVAGAKRVEVVFADGQESEAAVVSARPEHDLAVLQAKTVPDDLVPATLRSTRRPRPGRRGGRRGLPLRHRAVRVGGRDLRAPARVLVASRGSGA